MKNKKFKYLLFILSLGFIFLPMWYVPALQNHFPNLQVQKVVGYFGATKKPNFYGKRWMSGQYQQAYESFVKAKNPLHATAIRLKSQLDYSFYGDIMHANILSGKNNYLFQKEGCEAFIGKDFMGGKMIQDKVQKLKFLVDYFAKKDIPVVVLLPPLKARLMTEYLPDFYQKNQTDSTNWQVFSKTLNEQNIPNLNFDFLIDLYGETPYAIYPPSGQHWTKYGAALAAESIKSKLENLLNIKMNEMRWRDSIELSEARVTYDNELVAGANFIWNPPLDPLPYPKIRYLENDATLRPNVLSVGDSFYKLIMEFGIVDGLFNRESTFWYYNHEVYPLRLKDGKRMTNKDLNIMDEILQRDVIILTVFEDNLERFGFGFIDTVYDLIQEK